MMPDMDSYEVASNLKANPATANIPIIMVTANSDRNARLAGLNAGAEEFLTKPVDRAELWCRVRNLLRLKAFNDLLQNQSSQLEDLVQARTADLHRFAHYTRSPDSLIARSSSKRSRRRWARRRIMAGPSLCCLSTWITSRM